MPRKFILRLIFTRLLNPFPGVTGQPTAPGPCCLGRRRGVLSRGPAKRKRPGPRARKDSQDTGAHPAGVRVRKLPLAAAPGWLFCSGGYSPCPAPGAGSATPQPPAAAASGMDSIIQHQAGSLVVLPGSGFKLLTPQAPSPETLVLVIGIPEARSGLPYCCDWGAISSSKVDPGSTFRKVG